MLQCNSVSLEYDIKQVNIFLLDYYRIHNVCLATTEHYQNRAKRLTRLLLVELNWTLLPPGILGSTLILYPRPFLKIDFVGAAIAPAGVWSHVWNQRSRHRGGIRKMGIDYRVLGNSKGVINGYPNYWNELISVCSRLLSSIFMMPSEKNRINWKSSNESEVCMFIL